MNITFLDFDDIRNPLLGAGQAKATLEVGSRLAILGHSVTVLSSRYPGYTDRTEHGITYKHIGLSTHNIKVNNVGYFFAVPAAVRANHADIVVECFTAPVSTLAAPLFTKTPVVALPSSFDAERFSKLYHLPFAFIEHYLLRFYKYFMPYTAADNQKMYRYNPNINSSIIPEGVGSEFFTIKLRKPKYILYLGRIDINQKGLDLLLESYRTHHKMIGYPLVIAGKGEDEKQLLLKIKKYSLENLVTFVGPAFGGKKSLLLSEAVCVVMPSRNEGFSLFSLEALASGQPIVVYDIPGFSWTTAKSVIKVPAYNTRAYATALVTLINSSRLSTLRVNARETARPYTWDKVTKQFESYFSQILVKERITL